MPSFFPQAGFIKLIAALTTFYVSSTGSDSHPGTLIEPWATPQHANNFVAATYDLNGNDVLIQLEDGGPYDGWQLPTFFNSSGEYCVCATLGNGADNTAVTIAGDPNGPWAIGGGYQNGLPNVIVDSFTINSPGSTQGALFSYGQGNILRLGGDYPLPSSGIRFTNTGGASTLYATFGGFVNCSTNLYFDGHFDTIFASDREARLIAGVDAACNADFTNTTIFNYLGGAVNFASYVDLQNVSFTDAGATGAKINVTGGYVALPGQISNCPGNTFGILQLPGVVGYFDAGNNQQTLGPICSEDFLVADLPQGSPGMRTQVTNALAPTLGAPVTGGGAVKVPVYYDAATAAWLVG